MASTALTIDSSEARRFLVSIRRLPRDMREVITEALRAAARDIAGETRQLLRQASSPPPSRPGQPPHMVTSRLAKSIRTRQGRGGLSYSIYNQPEAFYGRILEIGTGDRSTRTGAYRGALAPRPFLTAALENRREDVNDRIAFAIIRTLQDYSD